MFSPHLTPPVWRLPELIAQSAYQRETICRIPIETECTLGGIFRRLANARRAPVPSLLIALQDCNTPPSGRIPVPCDQAVHVVSAGRSTYRMRCICMESAAPSTEHVDADHKHRRGVYVMVD